MSYLDINNPEMSGSNASTTASSATVPIVPVLGTVALLGIALVAVLHLFFPVFKPGDDLLILFPPEEIAQKREATFMLYRLLNPMLALGVFAIATAIAVPLVLGSAGKVVPGYTKMLLPYALLAAVLTCIGLALGHLVMELPAAKSLGLGRTFLARWLEFAFLGAGIGGAIGAAVGGKNMALRLGVNSAIVGVICALVLDLVFVPIATAKVDVLVPGGITWGQKDLLALSLFTVAAVVAITIGVTKELSAPK